MEAGIGSDLSRGAFIPALRAMLDTEAKQLQAVEDLYLVLKAQPKYKSLREPCWKAEQPPILVLQWILRKLGPLAGGNLWTIDTWQDRKKTRYRFVIYQHFNRNHFKDDWFFIPLDFLPGLKKRDPVIHDLIIDVVALVCRNNDLPLWDEDGDYSEQMSDLIRNRDSSIEMLDRQRQSYASGPAFEYLKLIRSRISKASLSDCRRRLEDYAAGSQRKQSLRYWLQAGLQLASGRGNLRPFNFLPDYTSCDGAIGPLQYFKFIWSYHENDYVHRTAIGLMRDCGGSYPPVMFSVARPGQRLKPILEQDFPIRLFRFMSYGWKHVLHGHREYYYKKQLDDQKTPSEVLLEQIEGAMIRRMTKQRK